MEQKRAKGIGLLSGGLDSILAVKVLQEQDLDLEGITFTTPFFDAESGLEAGRIAGIPMRVLDIGEKHLEMLRKPLHGYGAHMNPCIDCHALMLREAGRLMVNEGADFLFTGEVLGQRPMSQRRDALRIVEKSSGFAGRVLRPLSAKLLPPTIPEMEGLVDRSRLQDIRGRGRKRQIALAAHYGIVEYPQPGGGCKLTKEGFASRLRELLRHYSEITLREVRLLNWGRHLRLPSGSWYVVGRNRNDNEHLEVFAAEGDLLLRVLDYPGPMGLIVGSTFAENDLPLAGEALVSYSDAPFSEPSRVEWKGRGGTGSFVVKKVDKDEFRQYLV